MSASGRRARRAVVARVHLGALRVYRHLPTWARRLVVRTIAPSYTVGTMCVVERADGSLLLVRHSYRHRWGTPGGLVQRGEAAADAARREVREEVGLDIELVGEPAVVVEAEPQRVDLVYRARPRDRADAGEGARPTSPEILEVRWFPPHQLPELQAETVSAFAALARAAKGSAATPAWREAEGGPAGSDGGAS